MLTKSQILEGTNAIVKVKLETLDDEIYLRPLSVAEVNELEELEATAMGVFEATETNNRKRNQGQAQTKGKINLAKTTKASSEAKIKAVYLSINNEKNIDEWNIDDIKKINKKIFNEIYENVEEISGLKNVDLEDVEDFPADK